MGAIASYYLGFYSVNRRKSTYHLELIDGVIVDVA